MVAAEIWKKQVESDSDNNDNNTQLYKIEGRYESKWIIIHNLRFKEDIKVNE